MNGFRGRTQQITVTQAHQHQAKTKQKSHLTSEGPFSETGYTIVSQAIIHRALQGLPWSIGMYLASLVNWNVPALRALRRL